MIEGMSTDLGPDRRSHPVALLLLAGAVLWHGLLPLAGYDLWWQLALGREIVATGTTVPTEVFSHSFAL